MPDRARQQQDRHAQRHHDKDDHAADREAEDPAEVAGAAARRRQDRRVHRSSSLPNRAQTVSQKSRTGLRLAFTEVSRSGTVLVSCATAWTPPVVATRVARMALRWKMTRSRPTAVMAMISAATISVNQAAAGIAVLPSSAE